MPTKRKTRPRPNPKAKRAQRPRTPPPTPTFFVPHANGREGSEAAWQLVKAAMEGQGYSLISNRRIFRITFVHNAEECEEIVGERGWHGGKRWPEEIMFILDAGHVYLACSAQRGVLRGEPMLIGLEEVREVVEFLPDA